MLADRYRGPLGSNRRERVHHECRRGALHSVEVVVSVDSEADPLLAREAGLEASSDFLLGEPTELWREIARALGETGAVAVMPLAARLGRRTGPARERAAWALAHIAARGARSPLETLAAGRDPVAAGVARHALALVDRARDDELALSETAPRELTLNRAFARRFHEAAQSAERRAEAEAAAVVSQGAADTTTVPLLLPDESDLVEEVEVEVEVDSEMEVEAGDADADEPGEGDVAPS